MVAAERSFLRQMVSDDIKAAMTAVGACPLQPAAILGISARKGGILTAIEAGVAEDILYLQSGHGVSRVGLPYMHTRDPARLFEVFDAFGLRHTVPRRTGNYWPDQLWWIRNVRCSRIGRLRGRKAVIGNAR